MAEAKVVNTLVQLNLMDDHETTPELRKKIKALDTQITVALDFLGKRVNTDSDAVPGTVVQIMTAEEQYERDWEDMDDFDESKRGLMCLTVRWDGTSEDGEVYPPEIERGYSPEDLKVIMELPPRGEETVLGFSKRLMGEGSNPVVLEIQKHPQNGWAISVGDASVPPVSSVKLIQLTDNECNEAGGLTTRDVTPRG
jgi:hypothetical protein